MPEFVHLSHWDADTSVAIPPTVSKDLTNYHIMGIRFMYNCYEKKQKGLILNEDEDMNFPIQISALFSALYNFIPNNSPVIVICNTQSVNIWHNYLRKYTNTEINLIKEGSSYSDWCKIILCTVENLKWMERTDMQFFIVVIDNLDLNLNRRFVKQIKGQFHIGLTHRNFLSNPDQKLFRSMLLWAIPGVIGKLEDFIREDDEHLKNLRFPYDEWWLRLTWSFCDSFKKPDKAELVLDISANEERKIRPQKKRKVKAPPPKIESDSSQDTICDQENYQMDVDLPIETSMINEDVKSFGENAASQDEAGLTDYQDEPKMDREKSNDAILSNIKEEDGIESRNRYVLSLLYGDED